MPKIPVKLRNFKVLANGDKEEPVRLEALVKAAIAVGRAKEDIIKYGADSKWEKLGRVAAIRAGLRVHNDRFVRTDLYRNESKTDMGNRTYAIGNAVCAVLADHFLRTPWLLSLDVYEKKLKPTYAKTDKRPDYLGKAANRRWYVFESKGRTNTPSADDWKEWKEQSSAVKRVRTSPVECGLVSLATFNKAHELLTIWDDPESPDGPYSTLEIDEEQFFQLYYEPLLAFFELGEPGVAGSFGRLYNFRELDFSIGLHDSFRSALESRNIGQLHELATMMLVSPEELRTGSSGEITFADGVFLRLGPTWQEMVSLPVTTPIMPLTDNQGRTVKHFTSTVGEREKKCQQRIVRLFSDPKRAGNLGYRYLGNWEERAHNRNIEPEYLQAFLQEQKYDETLIKRTLVDLEKAAGNTSHSIYDRNKEVYSMLRYGIQVKTEAGEGKQTVWLIDWKNPEKNHFAIAEEVTVLAANAKGFTKRPDIVIYVNGIALGVLELKRSIVAVAEGIRQNLDNQKKIFIQHFFSTMQLVMAGNDTEGLRYGTIETKEKYYLEWKEERPGWKPGMAPETKYLTAADYPLVKSPLDRAILQLCRKERLLQLIHDFVVFDAGTKKLCRHNQYFGVRAAQERVKAREGGIIWHTQGSGKSLTMVWLTKWIRENVVRDGKKNARVLIITDRTELDEQIEKVFLGVNEQIYRTKSGADLIGKLNDTTPWLMCSLIHKFGVREDDEEVGDIPAYIAELKKALPPGFHPKGDIYVYVDECHRTQSGKLHDAMKEILPDAMFIGFTGTPLLKADKKKSLEVFGRYIHTYKYDEAVRDGVVLDLRYEARDIDQNITSQKKIDQWFEAKTKGLSDLAKAQLKQRWGTLKKVFSSQGRLQKIVADILMDMETRDRLQSGLGNALLVSGSIYQACKLYEMFDKTNLKGKCAIVTSFTPSSADLKGEESGEGATENIRKYEIYQKMLADWFNEAPEEAIKKVEAFEKAAKKKFIEEPGQMKLLIVVDKLLTGFDAPPATYLYIDKKMEDHGLFQAICRVNRLDTEDKEYGYIIDYKDLFKSLEGAITDYTSGAFDAYNKEDVEGLLKDRLKKAREHLEEMREAVKALCEPVEASKDSAAYLRYFCAKDSGNAAQLKDNEPNRLALYKHVAAFVRAYAEVANEYKEAGYTAGDFAAIKAEVEHYEKVRGEVKLASHDYVDLKMFEPAMRHLLDTYLDAKDSEKLSAFDDMTLVQMIVERGADAVNALPEGIRKNKEAVAETIENNVRKLIIDEHPINPKYYEEMSKLLDALIKERKREALEYKKYLQKIVELTKKVKNGPGGAGYPKSLDTAGKRALYDNLGKNEALALAVDEAVRQNRQDDWRGNTFKTKKVYLAIKTVLKKFGVRRDPEKIVSQVKESPSKYGSDSDAEAEAVLELVKSQDEY